MCYRATKCFFPDTCKEEDSSPCRGFGRWLSDIVPRRHFSRQCLRFIRTTEAAHNSEIYGPQLAILGPRQLLYNSSIIHQCVHCTGTHPTILQSLPKMIKWLGQIHEMNQDTSRFGGFNNSIYLKIRIQLHIAVYVYIYIIFIFASYILSQDLFF